MIRGVAAEMRFPISRMLKLCRGLPALGSHGEVEGVQGEIGMVMAPRVSAD